jgi:Sortase and related acyltransferases
MSDEIVIRTVNSADAEALLAIYAPYVRETAISFEYDIPSAEEFSRRIAVISARYPYLVAETDGLIVGYAYASHFKERAAYDHSVEVTVYVDRIHRGTGCGRKLYEALESILKHQNVINLYACIAHAPSPDEFLDNSSEAFHTRLGYKKVAHFSNCGYKFGRWYDMVWMEKFIGQHNNEVKQFTPVIKL